MVISENLLSDHPSGADKAHTVKYLPYRGKDLSSKFKMHRKKKMFMGTSLGLTAGSIASSVSSDHQETMSHKNKMEGA